jgi:hypothetical protein
MGETMRVSIAQPAYLPWCGLFERIRMSDLHIVLDHVPMSGGENRNKIRTPQGWQMLTVPIKKVQGQPISEIEIADDPHWRRKHLEAIRVNYARADFFDYYFPLLEHLMSKEAISFNGLSWQIFNFLRYNFECVKCHVKKSSDLKARGSKSDLNLNLCKEVGATTFIVGPGTYSFLDKDSFAQAGIKIELHDYQTPIYRQCWPGEFVPNMSAIDALFNLGRLP